MRPALAALGAIELVAASCSSPHQGGVQGSEGKASVYLLTIPPFHWAYPDPDSVKLVSADGNILKPEIDLEHRGTVHFTTSGAGPFKLLVDDPRFETAELEDLVPNEGRVEARLIGRGVPQDQAGQAEETVLTLTDT